MTLFKKALIAVPVALLVLAGEASAQRVRVGVGAGYGGYGGYGYPGYGYGGYGYGYGGPGVTVGFQSGRYGVAIGSGYGYPGYGYSGYGYPAYGYSGYGYAASSYPVYSTWSGGYSQPAMASYPATGYTVSPTYATAGVSPTYATGGVIPAGGVIAQDNGVIQTSAISTTSTPAPAKIDVIVPEDAEVWFDGTKNTDTGAQRKFVSKELQPGMPHTFQMKVRRTENGQEKTQEFTVPMHPGENSQMDARPLLD